MGDKPETADQGGEEPKATDPAPQQAPGSGATEPKPTPKPPAGAPQSTAPAADPPAMPRWVEHLLWGQLLRSLQLLSDRDFELLKRRVLRADLGPAAPREDDEDEDA